ncbi:MAG: ribosome small subunit-dependent GTPase A [Alicyclobacillus sp.]|nr:ribosome small subunit-dependent GTPase A [Alicyclobacillus sp.]
MPTGVVVRVLAGFYDVADGEVQITCRARGLLRKRGLKILVGDRVAYRETGAGEGVVEDVLPRVSELTRPPVANVTMAVLVFSIAQPDFQRYLLDKALVATAAAGVLQTIALTKCDLVDDAVVDETCHPYRQAGIEIIPVSVRTGRGVDAVKAAVSGHVAVFVGPSGAGKSSLGNAFAPELGLRMGEVSEKIGRGRHTTRHTELFQVAPGTFIADAAGFSQLQVEVDSTDLRRYFPEFGAFDPACAYRGCLHIEEDACAVKQAAVDGRLAASRYDSYRLLYQEIRRREVSRY